MFKIIKDIVGDPQTLDWDLSSITIDFEPVLLRSFTL